jgi:hypothetical protein
MISLICLKYMKKLASTMIPFMTTIEWATILNMCIDASISLTKVSKTL